MYKSGNCHLPEPDYLPINYVGGRSIYANDLITASTNDETPTKIYPSSVTHAENPSLTGAGGKLGVKQ